MLGIGVPMATAIVDAAAARRDYLDETGGRYVHVIADGGMAGSGDMAKAIACGADAVMLGEQLAEAADVPGPRAVLDLGGGAPVAAAVGGDRVRRPGELDLETGAVRPVEQPVRHGRTCSAALRRAMAKTGYSDLKEFQRVGLTVRS